jgi:hypothetical protein
MIGLWDIMMQSNKFETSEPQTLLTQERHTKEEIQSQNIGQFIFCINKRGTKRHRTHCTQLAESLDTGAYKPRKRRQRVTSVRFNTKMRAQI